VILLGKTGFKEWDVARTKEIVFHRFHKCFLILETCFSKIFQIFQPKFLSEGLKYLKTIEKIKKDNLFSSCNFPLFETRFSQKFQKFEAFEFLKRNENIQNREKICKNSSLCNILEKRASKIWRHSVFYKFVKRFTQTCCTNLEKFLVFEICDTFGKNGFQRVGRCKNQRNCFS
jgi:hypothetical protein